MQEAGTGQRQWFSKNICLAFGRYEAGDALRWATKGNMHCAPKGRRVAPRSKGAMVMPQQRISRMKFSSVYPLYIQKAERKNRTKEDVDQVICWLTGFSRAELQRQIELESDLETFFA